MLSLGMMLAIAGLWLRSYWRSDELRRDRVIDPESSGVFLVDSLRGGLRIGTIDLTCQHSYGEHDGPLQACLYRRRVPDCVLNARSIRT
jgi:hypothetical protein